MRYRNTEVKLDSLITYFKENRINLSPVFQRGRAWSTNARQELIKNIVRGRPIPAIFLYKKDAAEKYSFTIMDGKQRLESILMFIGDGHAKLKIPNWKSYFADHSYWNEAMFAANCRDGNQKVKFADFSDEEIRELREYVIPMIEITLDDESNLDEIIRLFVDINQRGARVSRTQIVRAMKNNDPLLKSVYGLVAEKRRVRQDALTKVYKGAFSSVLEKLSVVSSGQDDHARADRMWSRLMEFALYIRNNNTHGKGAEVLKRFVDTENNAPLNGQEIKKLRRVFKFLQTAYRSGLDKTRLASDYSHFYIMCTSLLSGDILTDPSTDDEKKEISKKLIEFGKFLEHTPAANDTSTTAQYLRLSSKQTTDAKKRAERQKLFKEILATL